jgi:hypothetical protein
MIDSKVDRPIRTIASLILQKRMIGRLFGALQKWVDRIIC